MSGELYGIVCDIRRERIRDPVPTGSIVFEGRSRIDTKKGEI